MATVASRCFPVLALLLCLLLLPAAGAIHAATPPPPARGSDPIATIAEIRRTVRVEAPRDGERRHPLREIWRFADGDEDVLFRSLDAALEVPDASPDGGSLLLLLDSGSSALHVFSAAGEHLRALDLAGEGPGRLDHPVDLVAMPDGSIGLLAASPARLVCIDPDGTWRGDLDLGRTARDLFQARHADSGGDRLLVAGQNSMDDKSFLAEFGLAGSAALRRLMEVPLESDFSRPRLVDRDGYLLEEKPWDLDRQGRIYLVPERNGHDRYQLEIYDGAGSVLAIERPYLSRRRGPAERNLARWRVLGPPAYADRFEGQLVIDEFEPDVHEVIVREGAAAAAGRAAGRTAGRAEPGIWVRTSRSFDVLPPGGLACYDVFAPDGEWLQEAVLMAPSGSSAGPTPVPCAPPAIHFLAGDRVLLIRGQFEAEYPGFCDQESGLEIICCEME